MCAPDVWTWQLSDLLLKETDLPNKLKDIKKEADKDKFTGDKGWLSPDVLKMVCTKASDSN